MDANKPDKALKWYEHSIKALQFSLIDELPDAVYQCFNSQLAAKYVLVVRGESLFENAVYIRVPSESHSHANSRWILVRPYKDDSPYYWDKPCQALFDLLVLMPTTLADWDDQFKTIGSHFSTMTRGADMAFMFFQTIAFRNMHGPGCLLRQTFNDAQKLIDGSSFPDPLSNLPSYKKEEGVITIPPTKRPNIPYAIPEFTLESIELAPDNSSYPELITQDTNDHCALSAATKGLILSRYPIRDCTKAEDRFLVEDMGRRFDARLRLTQYGSLFTRMLTKNVGRILLAAPYPVGSTALAPVGYIATIESTDRPASPKQANVRLAPHATLVSIAVNPDHRRQGIGRKLFLQALSRARRSLKVTILTTGRYASKHGWDFLASMCQHVNKHCNNSYSTKTYLKTIDNEETFTLEITKK